MVLNTPSKLRLRFELGLNSPRRQSIGVADLCANVRTKLIRGPTRFSNKKLVLTALLCFKSTDTRSLAIDTLCGSNTF